MGVCEVCGNDYYLSFEVVAAGDRHVFDSFECAIQKLVPVCAHCGCKVIGHGIEANGAFYCCAHCARLEGAKLGPRRRCPAGFGRPCSTSRWPS